MNAVLHRGGPAGGAPVRTRPRPLSVAVRAAPVPMSGAVDAVILAVRSGIGVTLLGLGWYEASGKLTLRAQAPWLTLAIAGTALVVAAQIAWVLRLRHAVSARIARVTDALPIVPRTFSVATADRLFSVAASDARLFHRAGCALTVGRPLTAASAEEHLRHGRIPCEVCEP